MNTGVLRKVRAAKPKSWHKVSTNDSRPAAPTFSFAISTVPCCLHRPTFLRADPLLDLFFNRHFEVSREFVVQFAIYLFSAELGSNPARDISQQRHRLDLSHKGSGRTNKRTSGAKALVFAEPNGTAGSRALPKKDCKEPG